jgi:hypothetical protein
MAMLGRWVAKFREMGGLVGRGWLSCGKWVAKLGKWVAKLWKMGD